MLTPIALQRLLAAGFPIVECPGSWPPGRLNMSINHGSVVLCAAPGVRLTPVVLDCPMVTIKAVAARIQVGSYESVVYRPGSAAIQPSFFHELSTFFKSAGTYSMPVFVIGDFNVRLDRTDDPHARQLLELVGSFSFHLCLSNSTHQQGGIIGHDRCHFHSSRPPQSACTVYTHK
jgi:hypothetical protein